MLKTIHYQIHSSRIPAAFDGLRIVHLSDLHGAVFGSGNRLLADQIDAFHPHLIAMTGDMADQTRGAFDVCLQLCRRLGSSYPVYYIFGNHEQTMEKAFSRRLSAGGSGIRRRRREAPIADFRENLKKAGATLLENESLTLRRGKDRIRLYGLVAPLVYYKERLGEYVRGIQLTKADVRTLLGKADPACYNILLAHDPLYFPAYRDWGADLTLSGHVHGGVIRVPGLGGLLSPDLSLFPHYDGGLFQENKKRLIVSRGLGNHFLIRVFNPPELVTITLFHS